MSTAIAEDARVAYQDLMETGRALDPDIVELCRASANVFGAYCFGYEPQPLHIEWNNIWDEYSRVSIWAPPEHGKTFHGVLVRFIWELGNNIHLQLMHASATAVVPTGTLRTAARHIYSNARVRQVFPDLRIDKFGREQANNLALWLRRPGMHTDRDPSWVAIGMGNQIHGRRVDGVCLDDILSYKNTRTPMGRDEVKGNVSNSIMGRVPAGGWIRFLGYPFFRDDCAHWIADQEGFFHRAYDVTCDTDGNPGPPGLWPHETPDPQTGKLYGWPWERVLAKEEETLEIDWWRQWKCRTPADEMSIYNHEMLQWALDLGRGLELGQPAPERIVPASGIDPATGDGSDKTAIHTGYTAGAMRRTLDVRGGLWDDERLYREMQKVLRLYPSHGGFFLEDNAFAKNLVRTLNRPDTMHSYGWTDEDIRRCRVLGFTTTAKNKHDHKVGVRALALDFKNKRTVLPSQPNGKPWPAMRELVQGFIDYDPNKHKKHVSDYVMAYWMCNEMQRLLGQLSGGRRPRI
jgi:hypothetical protein